MRYIRFDVDRLGISEDWKERAGKLKAALKDAGGHLERKKILDGNSIWVELRQKLRDISHGKCWYTESYQDGTDTDVDHFRPKGRVAEVTAPKRHEGYWWLAYEPSNYRFSCIYANRLRRDIGAGVVGGKADKFPLYDETVRAFSPDDDWENERPLLIDPCRPEEVACVTYKEDGEAMPRYSQSEPYKYGLAASSIPAYNLNCADFVRARQERREEIERCRKAAERMWRRLENGDADHQRSYREAIERLRELRNDKADFSAFSIAMMEKYRGEEYMAGVFV